jgi:hypothetical protein
MARLRATLPPTHLRQRPDDICLFPYWNSSAKPGITLQGKGSAGQVRRVLMNEVAADEQRVPG